MVEVNAQLSQELSRALSGLQAGWSAVSTRQSEVGTEWVLRTLMKSQSQCPPRKLSVQWTFFTGSWKSDYIGIRGTRIQSHKQFSTMTVMRKGGWGAQACGT